MEVIFAWQIDGLYFKSTQSLILSIGQWFKCAVNSPCKTTDFLTHAVQKAFNDVSVVTSGNITANAQCNL